MFSRYVALGDSQTEGLNDGDERTGYRGWADRLAERLADLNPDVRYANLAVRGRRTAGVRAEQLGPALALKPDLVTVMTGMNDLLRRRYHPADVADDLDAMYAALASTGACVLAVTFPDIVKLVPLARLLRPRVLDLNSRIRAAAARHGVVVFETFDLPVATDPRLWSADRIHASPEGHARIAVGVAHALDLPGATTSWQTDLAPLPPRTLLVRVLADLSWASTYLIPQLIRHARGRSSGDGCTAKRPALSPVRG
jgi:lysophospholipase L1-like esterase